MKEYMNDPLSLAILISKYKTALIAAKINPDWIFGNSRIPEVIKYRHIFIYYLNKILGYRRSIIALVLGNNAQTFRHNIKQGDLLINDYKDNISIKFYNLLEGIK